MVLRNPRGIAIVAAAAAIALGLALTVAAAAADARGQATAIGLIATMNGPSEVPAPTGDVSAARGASPRRRARTARAPGSTGR